MSLTQDERTRIVNRLNELEIGGAPCPQCGHGEWGLMNGVFVIPLRTMPDSGQITPLAGTVCPRCGLTRLFNLLVLGFDDIVRRFQATI